MGEKKRREKSDSSFGLIPKNLQHLISASPNTQPKSQSKELIFLDLLKDPDIQLTDMIQEITQMLARLETNPASNCFGAKIGNREFSRASKDSPELLLLWFEMVLFGERLRTSTITPQQIIDFWQEYWASAIPVLGRLDVRDTNIGDWLSHIKGVIMFVLEQQARILDQSSGKRFASIMIARKPILSMAEVTIEIALAFREDNVIYDGRDLIVYKGKDTFTERGELMIAVKHASGCWNHYPSPNNVRISLSEYKKAKIELAKFPTPLKGELIHSQSGKLAKTLGLTLGKDYAFLIPQTLLQEGVKFIQPSKGN
jgi:hypothetical protein